MGPEKRRVLWDGAPSPPCFAKSAFRAPGPFSFVADRPARSHTHTHTHTRTRTRGSLARPLRCSTSSAWACAMKRTSPCGARAKKRRGVAATARGAARFFFFFFSRPLFLTSSHRPAPPQHTHSGLDAVRSCARVFLEAYTSILTVGTDRLEALYGKAVTVADRETVESVRCLKKKKEETKKMGGAEGTKGAPFSLSSLLHTECGPHPAGRGHGGRRLPGSGRSVQVCACVCVDGRGKKEKKRGVMITGGGLATNKTTLFGVSLSHTSPSLPPPPPPHTAPPPTPTSSCAPGPGASRSPPSPTRPRSPPSARAGCRCTALAARSLSSFSPPAGARTRGTTASPPTGTPACTRWSCWTSG